MKKEALRVTTTVPVAPTTLYFAWIDSAHHAAMTGGAAAKIDPNVGAKFTALNGYVTGKLVILDLGRRIVMSWRTNDFPRDATDSRVEVHLEALGASTRVLVLHTDIPEGQSETYKSLWNDKYFGPMRSYFSKFLPDPRNPPVRRPPPPPPEDDEEEEEEDESPRHKKLGKNKGPGVAKTENKVAAKPSGKAAAPAKVAPPAKAAPVKAAPAKPAPTKKPAKPAKPAPAKKPAKPAKPAAKKPAKPAAKKK
jgi:uncharacterized protein YndB with AHSA1/START domain